MAVDLRTVGEVQARICRDNGSPLYEAIVAALVDRLDSDAAVTELLRNDPGDPIGTALFLRLLGAVHRLVLADLASPLRAYFPSTGGMPDVEAVVPVFFAVVEEHRDHLARAMQAEVQTNEVGRAAVLSAAVNWIVERIGGPVRLLEVGASAGLNLWLDRYRVTTDTAAWGPPDSPVHLDGHFASGSPPTPHVDVVERRGCDRNPLDLARPTTRDLLRSFIWPEHTERLARLDAAFAVADPVRIDRAHACGWVTEQLAALPADTTTVLFHSVVMQYLERADAAALRAGGPRRRSPTPGVAGHGAHPRLPAFRGHGRVRAPRPARPSRHHHRTRPRHLLEPDYTFRPAGGVSGHERFRATGLATRGPPPPHP